MKKFLHAVLVTLLMLCGTGVCSNKHQTTIDKYFHSVGIMLDNKNVSLCTATAFERVPGGFNFVSASHCLWGEPTSLIDDWGGKKYPLTVVAYGDRSKLYDFAVFFAAAPPDAFTIAPLGHDPRHISEHVYSVSSPADSARAYVEGIVSLLDIKSDEPILEEDDNIPPYTWRHNIGTQVLGLAPGSSGSSLVCRDQEKVCMIFVGVYGAMYVAEPIERFTQWWADVKSGKIPHVPVYEKLERKAP